ncbi:4a-hydroxytetrahydrobiopterin dehydratase [bacterium]|jgi:4a-hydroxytetrahydrobiopterin dehydratase|nr:4a-hydroxytetrahydrobiopterin dehydratase [bacterium]
MPNDEVLSPEAISSHLEHLPGWEVLDGWLRKRYATPGWTHTLLVANTIGYLAEAGWHHPDLSLGYAQVTVKLQTHSARGITNKDIELARKIDEVILWKPSPGDALTGFPKNWVKADPSS